MAVLFALYGKKLCNFICNLFFFFPPYRCFRNSLAKFSSPLVIICYPRDLWQDWANGKLINIFVTVPYIVKCRACKHSIPGALEKNVQSSFNLEHMEHCSSTTKSIFPLPQCIWTPTLAGWWLTIRGVHPFIHTTLWSPVFLRSRENLKRLFIHHHNVYGNQKWWDGDISWGAFKYRGKWSVVHMVIGDQLTS